MKLEYPITIGYSEENNIKGCFYTLQKNEEKSIEVTASSHRILNSSPQSVIMGRRGCDFHSENVPLSWLEVNLKNGFYIKPDSYVFGHFHPVSDLNGRTQNWELFGKFDDGSYIQLDFQKSITNQEFIQKYDLDTNVKFVGFKLVGGKRGCGDDYLCVGNFEVFGTIIKEEEDC